MLISRSFSLVLATRSVEDSRKLGELIGATVREHQPGLPMEAEIDCLHPRKEFFYHLNQFITGFCLGQHFIVDVQILKREVNPRGVFEVEWSILDSWIFGGPVALGGGLAFTSHIVDDCITCGTTARLCYKALLALGNHMDGLIWVITG